MIEGSVAQRPLAERIVHIPRMSYGSARLFAAAFHSLDIEAVVLPENTPETLRMAGAYTSGDECLPQRITLGGMLKVMSEPGFDPSKAAFFMPTTHGPCRFGQYSFFFRKIFRELGYDDIVILALTTSNGYSAFGADQTDFSRTAWRALVAGDILHKLLLKIRPYECNRGETDAVYDSALKHMSAAIARHDVSHGDRMRGIVRALEKTRDDFRRIPVHAPGSKPLIGAIGEIYCRLDDGANDNLVRIIEAYGGEVWLAGICEWLEYTNDEVLQNLRLNGRTFSAARVAFELRRFIQRKDEHALARLFKKDFQGYEEPSGIEEIFNRAQPYLPSSSALGEMVINTGRAVYLYEKGVDGIADISPFTCMNAIVSEAIYPRISRDHNAIPIRVFYFDGKTRDWGQDVEMFMELAREYKKGRGRGKD